MALDDLLITTGVDAFVRLVKERKKIELENASRILQIPVITLEEWARIMEEEGIIKLRYQLTKIFIEWVPPTEEEIKKDKESFYLEKKDVEKEVSELKNKTEIDIENLQEMKKSFEQIYAKLYPDIEKMRNELEAFSKWKESVTGKNFNAITARLEEIRLEISDLRNEIEKNQQSAALLPTNQLAKKQPANKQATDKKTDKEFTQLEQEMKALAKRVEVAIRTIPKESPGSPEIKKKLENLKREMEEIKKTNAIWGEDVRTLAENEDITKTIKDSVADYEKKISSARIEARDLYREMDEIKKKSSVLEEKITDDVEALARVGDSLEVSKEILARFPSQKELIEKIKETEKKEEFIEEKIKIIEKLSSSLGDSKTLFADFEQLRKKIDENTVKVNSEMKDVLHSIDEEKKTYETIQKIKERTLVSLQSYGNELKEIEKKIAVFQNSAEEVKNRKEPTPSLKKDDLEKIDRAAQKLEEKSRMIEELRASLEELVVTAGNLKQNIEILNKEASLIQIRESGAEAPKKEEEVRAELNLTKKEEEEFRRKREELRDLIKKLWEA